MRKVFLPYIHTYYFYFMRVDFKSVVYTHMVNLITRENRGRISSLAAADTRSDDKRQFRQSTANLIGDFSRVNVCDMKYRSQVATIRFAGENRIEVGVRSHLAIFFFCKSPCAWPCGVFLAARSFGPLKNGTRSKKSEFCSLLRLTIMLPN